MLSPVAVFLLLVSTDASTVNNYTYEYEDPDTGDTHHCALCPPGTFVSSPCTQTLDTVCLPCPPEHFTEFWNFLPKCLYCSTVCEGTRVVKHQCSEKHNRVCECREGHYWQDDFCVPHTQCPPGFGTRIIGNTQRDTQCQECHRGTFSAVTSSRAPCLNHTDCGNLHVLHQGRTWHDRICASCDDLTSKGLNLVRDLLPGFLSQRNIKLRKLKKLARSLGVNGRRYHHTTSQLLHQISAWTKNASTHQLEDLLKALQKSGLNTTADKVQDLLTRVKEMVSVCLNV